MSKLKKFARIGFVAVGIGNALLDAIAQHNEMSLNPRLRFDWSRLLVAFIKGGSVGIAIGAVIGGVADNRNSLVRPINSDGYLKLLSHRVRLDKETARYQVVNTKADWLASALLKRFSKKMIGPPERLGSTEKGTALQRNFDIDIGLNFRHCSFSSTAKMRFAVFYFLKKKIGRHGIIHVREQRSSIGVLFKVENQEFKIDVVPVKITQGDRNIGYLSVIRKSMLFDRYSHQKTNISVLKKLKLSNTQKRIVLLLKHWKNKNEIPIGSYLLENLVLDAYERTAHIPDGFTDKVMMVLKHISENLDVAVIRSIENSNNILTNIDESKKSRIISACEDVVSDYKHQPSNIKKLF